MSSVVRAVTVNGKDLCTNHDPIENVTKGHCIDLWHRLVKDLDFDTSLTLMNWTQMMEVFRRGEADVLVYRIAHGDMERENAYE